MSYDYLFKFLLVGDSGCGKSSILMRYTDNSFTESFISTIGVDFKIKNVDINGTLIKIQIWDTAGQERFRTITSSYYRGAHGIFVVYDVSNLESFRNVIKWIDEVKKFSSENIPVILLANKTDIESSQRQISTQDGQDLADKLGIHYFETSAKNDVNITISFERMCNEIVKIPELEKKTGISKKYKPIQPVPDIKKQESSCCYK